MLTFGYYIKRYRFWLGTISACQYDAENGITGKEVHSIQGDLLANALNNRHSPAHHVPKSNELGSPIVGSPHVCS